MDGVDILALLGLAMIVGFLLIPVAIMYWMFGTLAGIATAFVIMFFFIVTGRNS